MSIRWWFRSPTVGEALARPHSLRMRIYWSRNSEFQDMVRRVKDVMGPVRDAGDQMQQDFERRSEEISRYVLGQLEQLTIIRKASVEDAIDQWHRHPDPEVGPLHEFLGWTWEEYAAYVERGELPTFRKGAL